MITTWKLFNFKSVKKETDLEFAPLTIFAGANSSGKSTVIQSILLVAQTLAHKVSSRSVVLNGALAKLGQFDDLRSIDSDANQIVIGWTCKPHMDLQASRVRTVGFRRWPIYYGPSRRSLSSVSCEFAFEVDPTSTQREVAQIQPRLFSSQLGVTSRDRAGVDKDSHMTVRRADGEDEAKQRWMSVEGGDEPIARSSLMYKVDLDRDSLDEVREDFASAEPIGCLLRHFLPERLALGVDMVVEDARFICDVLIGEGRRAISRRFKSEQEVLVPSEVVEFVRDTASRVDANTRSFFSFARQTTLFEQDHTGVSLDDLYSALRRLPPPVRIEIRRTLQESDEFSERVLQAVRNQRKQDLAIIPLRPIGALAEASWYLDQFFSMSVRYLGPLRDEPRPLYPLAPAADPMDVGLRGEHTAAVLELHKKLQIQYVPTSCFSGEEIKVKRATRSLEAAVVEWLHYLGVAEAVQTRDLGKLGHELKVSVSGTVRAHDLTHVGVGVSQVLPILVASLLAELDTTLIFEQPELHLHPKVQTLLGDFFLSMTALGKQCIVETHSEYLINRLRFRTAAAIESNPWVEALRVYFVERSDEGSSFRDVHINEYGAVLDWPAGFFDQSQLEAEAILRAAANKRKKKQRGE
ncbi:MAG: DUF3696 domain-containing protein [Desulfobacterales bacterium]|nr:DUF3696 domain-containing protein [Desulfobacterales bacterium]